MFFFTLEQAGTWPAVMMSWSRNYTIKKYCAIYCVKSEQNVLDRQSHRSISCGLSRYIPIPVFYSHGHTNVGFLSYSFSIDTDVVAQLLRCAGCQSMTDRSTQTEERGRNDRNKYDLMGRKLGGKNAEVGE